MKVSKINQAPNYTMSEDGTILDKNGEEITAINGIVKLKVGRSMMPFDIDTLTTVEGISPGEVPAQADAPEVPAQAPKTSEATAPAKRTRRSREEKIVESLIDIKTEIKERNEKYAAYKPSETEKEKLDEVIKVNEEMYLSINNQLNDMQSLIKALQTEKEIAKDIFKPTKTTKPGVIKSIIDALREGKKNHNQVLEFLKEKFPERDQFSMMVTVRNQLTVKIPTRLERNHNVKIAYNETDKTYSISQ